jgi:hypothetical protein
VGQVIDNDRMRVFASFCKKKGLLFFFETKNQKTSTSELTFRLNANNALSAFRRAGKIPHEARHRQPLDDDGKDHHRVAHGQ